MDLFKKVKEFFGGATESLSDMKDAAMEKATELANSETVTNLKNQAADLYEKAQTEAAEAAEAAKKAAAEAATTTGEFWDKAKAYAEEKTEAVKDMLDGDEGETKA
jgi:hypothetical protein